MGKVKLRIEPLTPKENWLRDKRLAEFAEKQARRNDSAPGGYWCHFQGIKERINAMLNW